MFIALPHSRGSKCDGEQSHKQAQASLCLFFSHVFYVIFPCTKDSRSDPQLFFSSGASVQVGAAHITDSQGALCGHRAYEPSSYRGNAWFPRPTAAAALAVTHAAGQRRSSDAVPPPPPLPPTRRRPARKRRKPQAPLPSLRRRRRPRRVGGIRRNFGVVSEPPLVGACLVLPVRTISMRRDAYARACERASERASERTNEDAIVYSKTRSYTCVCAQGSNDFVWIRSLFFIQSTTPFNKVPRLLVSP
jgi:hypothetical protein